ncbi:cohesin domain-containing protein [Paenibacillus sp. N3.4]|uniref:cohesin domain-containing protein n=1 Tax=Paenibacillus sp. N3.4 TaxID=2603222 RepID=UPI001C9D0036|nr:cohesin domain-containing protein [Paenibacillus sp. N3.4]
MITSIPTRTKIAPATTLKIQNNSADALTLNWTASKDALSYNVYRAVESAPDYELIASNVQGTSFTYQSADLKKVDQCTFRVTAVAANGRESDGITTLMLQPNKPDNVAKGITSIKPLALNEKSITLPSVPEGFTIRIKSSDNTSIIQTDGTIVPPNFNTTVKLVLEVTRASDGTTAVTAAISVVVPGTSLLFTITTPNGYTTIYGNRILQLTADHPSNNSVTWSVSNQDGTSTTDAVINARGLMYATKEGTYKVSATTKSNETAEIVVTFTKMSSLSNLAVTGNGSAFGSTSGGSYPPTNVFDGKTTTFFDHSTTVPYVGWDFGAGNAKAVNFIRFYPRTSFEARMTGGKIQGSNSATSGYVDLYTFTASPPAGWNFIALDNKTPYRYYRFLGIDGSHGNVALLELYVNIDRTELGNRIAEAQGLHEEDYISSTWDALKTVLSDASSVNDNAASTQAQIDNAAANLLSAVRGLKPDQETASYVAAGITEIDAPAQGETVLTLPDVPDGFTVAIKSSDRTDIIGFDGTIHPPDAETIVNVVLEVTRLSDHSKASTAALSVTIPAKKEQEQQPLKAVLSGAEHVNAGGSFYVTYGLSNVKGSIYAQDLTFTYDPAKVEFVAAESLKVGFQIVKQKEMPGHIRILAASLGASQAVNTDGNLLKLTWKAKALTESAQTAISLSSAVVSDDNGVETQLQGVSHNVSITYVISVDKTVLNNAISNAQSIHDSAVEGSGDGQYPAGSKGVLQSAIERAKAVANNTAASKEEVNTAVTDLNAAISAFTASIITRVPGDLNGDSKVTIGDLAIVARYYGTSSADPDWDLYKFADLNHDGKIDIEDLAIVARVILESLQ